jgi:tetratricopeptide (TPR) repeat protein
MKINADRTAYDAKLAAKDADFWDWYTRRLLDDKMYRRDFAGQKSFSKLRAAIAGLYQKQGRFREGAQAFREACLLYPASPEATFRYVQESLLPFRRWDVVNELMDYTDMIDSKNKRTAGLREYVARISALTSEIERIEELQRSGKINDRDRFMLSRCYFEVGRVQEAGQLMRSIFEKLTGVEQMQIAASILMSAGLSADAETAYNRYLRSNPRDANAWAELAKLQYRTGRKQVARQSFIQGYNIDRQMLFQRLQRDQELYEIAAPLFRGK